MRKILELVANVSGFVFFATLVIFGLIFIIWLMDRMTPVVGMILVAGISGGLYVTTRIYLACREEGN